MHHISAGNKISDIGESWIKVVSLVLVDRAMGFTVSHVWIIQNMKMRSRNIDNLKTVRNVSMLKKNTFVKSYKTTMTVS